MENYELLCRIVQTEQHEFTKFLVKTTDVNHVDTEGKFPLFYAYEKKNIPQMKILLDNGADINKKFKNLSLLQHECDKNQVDEEMIIFLMDNKADFNVVWPENKSIIRRSIESGNLPIIKTMLSYEFKNINLQDDKGITAFRTACAYGYDDIAMFLLEKGADPNIQGKDGYSALIRSVTNFKSTTVSTLLLCDNVKLDLQDNDGNTALHHACQNKLINIVHLLLLHGASVSIKNNNGDIALEMNSHANFTAFFEKINNKKVSPMIINNSKIQSPIDIKPVAQLLFTVPHDKQHLPKKIASMDSHNSSYRTWNKIFNCWDNYKSVPSSITLSTVQIEYVDEKIWGHSIDGGVVRFDYIITIDGTRKYAKDLYN
jgi:ankyrin repeat protein